MKKITIIVALILGAIVYIGITSLSTPLLYYLTVSELHNVAEAKGSEKITGKRLKVVGNVVEGSLVRATKDDPFHRFQLFESGKLLAVAYRGPLPDQFHEGRQVVANGKLTSLNELTASEVLVKCASKYEEL